MLIKPEKPRLEFKKNNKKKKDKSVQNSKKQERTFNLTTKFHHFLDRYLIKASMIRLVARESMKVIQGWQTLLINIIFSSIFLLIGKQFRGPSTKFQKK